MGKAPDHEAGPRMGAKGTLTVLTAGLLSAFCAYLLGGTVAPVFAGIVVAGALVAGNWIGDRHRAQEVRLHLYRVADELVQYRAFTRLLRAQAERIVGLTGEAAMVIAEGLRDMDERVARLAEHVAEIEMEGDDRPSLGYLRGQVSAISEPVVDMVGKLQFQDVTQQQLMFLSRLSLLLDDHIGELTRLLGDRRSLERSARFKELFDAALDDTVMMSQRNDHHRATGVDFVERNGPRVEMFASEGEQG